MPCLDLDELEIAMASAGKLAKARGARDYREGIPLLEGMNAFMSALASREELYAYGTGYSRAMVESIFAEDMYTKVEN